ncbi:MAG: hypothetical protein FWD57_00890 [Polyangiaceae bacterium]|nr:hypothetical protein [Polyangiaceae bacterium]
MQIPGWLRMVEVRWMGRVLDLVAVVRQVLLAPHSRLAPPVRRNQRRVKPHSKTPRSKNRGRVDWFQMQVCLLEQFPMAAGSAVVGDWLWFEPKRIATGSAMSLRMLLSTTVSKVAWASFRQCFGGGGGVRWKEYHDGSDQPSSFEFAYLGCWGRDTPYVMIPTTPPTIMMCDFG